MTVQSRNAARRRARERAVLAPSPVPKHCRGCYDSTRVREMLDRLAMERDAALALVARRDRGR